LSELASSHLANGTIDFGASEIAPRTEIESISGAEDSVLAIARIQRADSSDRCARVRNPYRAQKLDRPVGFYAGSRHALANSQSSMTQASASD